MSEAYSRIYHKLSDEYPEIYDGPDLAGFVRLLVAADQAWPSKARWAGYVDAVTMARLVRAGLIVVVGEHRYTIKGLDKEREERSEAARYAVNKRWEYARNTDRTTDSNTETIPRREETRREENSLARAREGLPNITSEVQEAGESITGHGILTAGDKQLTELDRLCEDHGASAVVSAMRSVADGKRKSWRQLIWDSVKVLEPLASSEDVKRAEDDQADKRRWDAARRHIESLRAPA